MGLPASGAVWNEVGDAGDLLGTSQAVTGSGPLTQINGVVPGPDDIDLYQIAITNPSSFSAVSTGGLPFGPPRLFLFDASGVGVSGYFDSTNTGASLTGTFVTSPGVYYLALSGFSVPEDAPTAGLQLWNAVPADVERAPDGPGAANALGGWSPSIVPFNPTGYTIDLTGAAFVPEPGTLALLALGGLALTRRRRA